MAWVDEETIVFGGDTVIHQRGDQTEGFFGHRISVNGTPSAPVPLARVAQSGLYRAVDAVFNLQATYLPTLFKVSTS